MNSDQIQGWQMVPVKITPAMENADPYGMGYGRLHAIWSSLLAAAPKPPAQEPVGYGNPDAFIWKDFTTGKQVVSIDRAPHGARPLYAAPKPSDDVAKDAARYRWLIEEGDDMQWMNIIRVEVDDYPSLTAAIDAAMAGAGNE